jgi:hypothetical protein
MGYYQEPMSTGVVAFVLSVDPGRLCTSAVASRFASAAGAPSFPRKRFSVCPEGFPRESGIFLVGTRILEFRYSL